MKAKILVVVCILFPQVLTDSKQYSFPENFLFGVATASYQIEGAFNEDGKTDSIWDYNLHKNPNWVADKTNGDVACDSYRKWEEDIQLVKELGANFYRMSIAWTRILPSGHAGSQINEKGVAYYNNIINKLLSEGIFPMVTIYHWDLPQSLQENGGWMNRETIDHYVFYAQTLFDLFGDRVKHWFTFNEPYEICESGYSDVKMAPFFNASGIGGYACSHNVLLAHGRIYRLYEKLYKPTQNGQVSITIDSAWYEPKDDNSDSDKEATQRIIQLKYGWYMHPLVKGNYPPIMIQRIGELSKEEGFPESRLPKFTESEIEMIRGSYDFLGLNHYTTSLIQPSQDFNRPSDKYDWGVQESGDPNWKVSKTSDWLKDVPWGLRKLLNWIKEEYGNPKIFVAENGWSSTSGLEDNDRVRYINGYLTAILEAIHEDGCNVFGYSHWSLLDNFEWLEGYRFPQVLTDSKQYSFPENFLFGVATASYQIEGAFNEDGKTDSIWDYNLHKNPDWVTGRANGDVACDSYHKWEEDIQLVKELGANFYRMSIAWTRILPSGHAGSQINEKGVAYYNNIINKLLSEGIFPMVTIYHWDLPQSLQENGGWMNPDIIEHYVFYAQTLFDLFGDRVKHWFTFNEPMQICEQGYSEVQKAPFLNATGIGGYICGHNLLLSHGRIYRLYEKLYKPTQNGQVSITLDTAWYEPKDANSDSDKKASEQYLQMKYGWCMHPLIKGNYPPIMIQRIDEFSKQEGFPTSRLPKFTESEIEMIRGSYDFLGLNHYATSLVELSQDFDQPSEYYDWGVQESDDPEWKISTQSFWVKYVPWGLRKLLVWIKEEYGNPQIIISENGWSSSLGLVDNDRVRYINGYLTAILEAIHEDGCNVFGYTHWSLLDNLEWLEGYSSKFGLVEIDFDSPERTRTPRLSYKVYQNIIKSRVIN